MQDLTPIRRVLFIRLSSLGDVVRTLPVIGGFKTRHPGADVGLLTNKTYTPCLERIPFIDHLHAWPTRSPNGIERRSFQELRGEYRQTIRGVRRTRYHRSYNFHPSLKAGFVSALLGIRERYSFGTALDREGGFVFSTGRVNPDILTNRLDQYAELVRSTEANFNPDLSPVPLGPANPPGEVETFLNEAKLKDRDWIAFYPGSSAGRPEKRWPMDSYVRLGKTVESRLKMPLVVVPGSGETELARGIAGQIGDGAVVAPERTLPSLLSLIGRCRMLVGGDTGPAHAANIMGVPVVMIFGPSDPTVYAPQVGRFEVLGGLRGTGRPHRSKARHLAPPTSQVSVQQAYEACERLLNRTRL